MPSTRRFATFFALPMILRRQALVWYKDLHAAVPIHVCRMWYKIYVEIPRLWGALTFWPPSRSHRTTTQPPRPTDPTRDPSKARRSCTRILARWRRDVASPALSPREARAALSCGPGGGAPPATVADVLLSVVDGRGGVPTEGHREAALEILRDLLRRACDGGAAGEAPADRKFVFLADETSCQ